MNVLWICNVAIPSISISENLRIENAGCWMIRSTEEISKCVDITYAFPNRKIVCGTLGNIKYKSFPQSEINEKGTKKALHDIITSDNFDVIHIHGTEFKHTYIALEICNSIGIIDRCVVSIQGMVSVCAKHFYTGLDPRIIYGYYPRDLFRGNINSEKKAFERRGNFEVRSLQMAENVIGRTIWDKTCVYDINPNLKYYVNNETLRDSFYQEEKWTLSQCTRHTIFMSQASYPIKGGHFAIEAIGILKRRYPDIQLRIAGKNMIDVPFYKKSYYQKYLSDLINKYNIRDNVSFMGQLDETQMIAEYKNANAFISASTIENSPNSVCEAQILGVPVISSMVGGVQSLITHEISGLLYQSDAPYMLAHYIDSIFKNDDLSNRLSRSEIKIAEKRHNVNDITSRMLSIYSSIIG